MRIIESQKYTYEWYLLLVPVNFPINLLIFLSIFRYKGKLYNKSLSYLNMVFIFFFFFTSHRTRIEIFSYASVEAKELAV